jgi:plasmid replication initiation protein
MAGRRRNGPVVSVVKENTMSAAQLPLQFDSPLVGKMKNDRTMMVWNFFALTKDKTTKLPVYDDGVVRIEVKSNEEGVATIWDKELLIYMASLMQDRMSRGEAVSRTFTFTANDFFRVCKIHPGGASYERIEPALRRLKGTTVYTNIETGGEGSDGGFSWVTDYNIHYRRDRTSGEKILKSLTVEICPWLFRALVRHSTILTYDPGYFDLSPLEKRLYEIARAHCGEQACFKIGLEKLRLRVGSDTELKKFKLALTKIAAKRKPLPEYGLSVVDPRRMRTLDHRQPTPTSRTPLKSYMVFFYRLDQITRATLDRAPELPDHDL